MLVFETVAVAFGMFSALPLPQPQWNERNMRYAMCAFPLIGAVCGGVWYAWALFCQALALPVLLRAAGFCLVPVLITGEFIWTVMPIPATPWPAAPIRPKNRPFWQTLTAVLSPSFGCAAIL